MFLLSDIQWPSAFLSWDMQSQQVILTLWWCFSVNVLPPNYTANTFAYSYADSSVWDMNIIGRPKTSLYIFLLNLFKSEVVALIRTFLQCITDQWCIKMNSASRVGWKLDLTHCRLELSMLNFQCWRRILFRPKAEFKVSSPELKAWLSVSCHPGRAVRAPSEVTRRRWHLWALPRRSGSGSWRSCCSKRRRSSSREVSVRERQGIFCPQRTLLCPNC